MTVKTYSTSPLILTIDDFLSKTICDALVLKTEDLNYKKAPITIDGSKGIFEMNSEIRNNTRVIVDEDFLAFSLFQQIKKYLPSTYKNIWQLTKLNPRFRYYRYGVDQKFSPHIDGKYRESNICESKLTLLVYLSEDFTGGETTFFGKDETDLRFKITPKIGQVLVFDHHQLHAGETVTSGIKYVLRTDVMYTRSIN